MKEKLGDNESLDTYMDRIKDLLLEGYCLQVELNRKTNQLVVLRVKKNKLNIADNPE